MNRPAALKRLGSTALVLAAIMSCGVVGAGCAYSGVAATPDGTVIIARNSVLGALRKVFICKVVGNDLNCVPSASPP